METQLLGLGVSRFSLSACLAVGLCICSFLLQKDSSLMIAEQGTDLIRSHLRNQLSLWSFIIILLCLFLCCFLRLVVFGQKKKHTMVSLYVDRCHRQQGMIPGEARMKLGMDLVSQAGSNSVVRP